MGIDSKRFVNPLPQDLICPICHDVFDDPVQCPEEHIFCRDCISKWMMKINRCPLDQKSLSFIELTPSARVLRNLIGSLELRCEFMEYGCNSTTTLESMKIHLLTCKFRSVMERRTEEINLLQQQIEELINDVTTMGKNNHLLNEALSETNAKLETAILAIDDLQIQVDNKDGKLAQLETKLQKLEQSNEVKLKKFNSEFSRIHNVLGNLVANQRIIMDREFANASSKKDISEATQEVTASLAKLISKLNEADEHPVSSKNLV